MVSGLWKKRSGEPSAVGGPLRRLPPPPSPPTYLQALPWDFVTVQSRRTEPLLHPDKQNYSGWRAGKFQGAFAQRSGGDSLQGRLSEADHMTPLAGPTLPLTFLPLALCVSVCLPACIPASGVHGRESSHGPRSYVPWPLGGRGASFSH